jgi:hypothetical protein
MGDAQSASAAAAPPAPVTTLRDPLDIRNYKCVPLDLLKNIGKNAQGNDVIGLTSDQPTLKDFKEQNEEALRLAGPGNETLLSADDIENLIVWILVSFVILIFVVILFWGFLNFRTYGLAAFQLPQQLRSLPVMAFVSIFFGVI